MIKTSDFFKRKIIIILLLLIVIIALIFTIKKNKDHSIEFYVLEDSVRLQDLEKMDYDALYKSIKNKVEPVLTEEDIVGYDTKNKIFILKEELREKRLEFYDGEDNKALIYGGSVYLGTAKKEKMVSGGFIIVIDDKVFCGGTIELGFASSYLPQSYIIKDVKEGLMLYTVIDNIDEKLDEASLIKALKDMAKEVRNW